MYDNFYMVSTGSLSHCHCTNLHRSIGNRPFSKFERLCISGLCRWWKNQNNKLLCVVILTDWWWWVLMVFRCRCVLVSSPQQNAWECHLVVAVNNRSPSAKSCAFSAGVWIKETRGKNEPAGSRFVDILQTFEVPSTCQLLCLNYLQIWDLLNG